MHCEPFDPQGKSRVVQASCCTLHLNSIRNRAQHIERKKEEKTPSPRYQNSELKEKKKTMSKKKRNICRMDDGACTYMYIYRYTPHSRLPPVTKASHPSTRPISTPPSSLDHPTLPQTNPPFTPSHTPPQNTPAPASLTHPPHSSSPPPHLIIARPPSPALHHLGDCGKVSQA